MAKRTPKTARMIEILETVERWRSEGQRIALATVVGVEKSAPRDPGAVLAVNERGDVAGSVSGGWWNRPSIKKRKMRLAAVERAWSLTGSATSRRSPSVSRGGGTIHIFIERLDW